MGMIMIFLFLVGGLLIVPEANTAPPSPPPCEYPKAVMARAADEICDHFLDAAEACFTKLNKTLVTFESHPPKTSAKNILKQAERIRDNYDAAVPIVKGYLEKMEIDSCGDQKERVQVMVDELKTDLATITKRINDLKPPNGHK